MVRKQTRLLMRGTPLRAGRPPSTSRLQYSAHLCYAYIMHGGSVYLQQSAELSGREEMLDDDEPLVVEGALLVRGHTHATPATQLLGRLRLPVRTFGGKMHA